MDTYIDTQTGIEYSADKKIILSSPYECAGEIHIPEGVEVIEDSSLMLRPFITAFYIPASVRLIKHLGMCGCKNLKKIVVDKNNPVYDSRDNCNAVIETAKNKIIVGCTRSHLFEGIKEIGAFAFDHQLLSSVTIPRTVDRIGGCAFSNCSALSSVTIFPETYLKIDNYAFTDCPLLDRIILYPDTKYVPDDGAVYRSFDASTRIIVHTNNHMTVWDGYDSIGQMLRYIYEELSQAQLKIGSKDFAFNGGKQWVYVYQVLLKYNKDSANQIVIHNAKEFCQELNELSTIPLDGLSTAALSGEIKEVINWEEPISDWRLNLDYISSRKLSMKQREINLSKGKEIAIYVENLLNKMSPM